MRINLTHTPQATPQSDRIRAQSSAAGGNSAAKTQVAEDNAQLSGAHAQVEALAAEALQLPEVRQERVEALRLAVMGGQYQSDPQKVAGALAAHMMMPAAAQG
jgi:flagellar biosynthesis anti-sigma factor FlgM